MNRRKLLRMMRGGVATASAPAADTTPDPFSFAPVTGAGISTPVESETIVPTGFDVPVPIAITGGEYRIGSGSWTALPGIFPPGSSLTTRLTSSASYSTLATATVTLGGVSGSFSVTTQADPAAGGFDYVVTNDGGAGVANSLASVLALGAAALSGKTIGIQPGTYAARTITLTGNASKITLAPTDPLNPPVIQGTLVFNACSSIEASGLVFRYSNTGAPYVKSNAVVTVVGSGSNVALTGCEIDSDSPTLEQRYEGVRGNNGTTITVDGCTIHHVRSGVIGNALGATWTVKNCTIHHFYEDGIQENDANLIVTDNVFRDWESESGRRWNGTITGTPIVGELMQYGSGTSMVTAKVIAVGSGYMDLQYNNYRKPAAPNTLTGLTSGATFQVGTENASGYDRIHGDCIQPINDNATGNRNLLIARNKFLRTQPYVFDQIGQMDVQNIFIENARGKIGVSNKDWDWGEIRVENNLCSGNQVNGIAINGPVTGGGTCINNTVLQGSTGAGVSKISINASDGLIIFGNVGDNNSSGPVDVDAGTYAMTDYDGDNNGGVRMTRATINALAVFPLARTFPLTKEAFIPASGSTVDTGRAGALTPDGRWRGTTIGAN